MPASIYTPEHRRLTAMLREAREKAGLSQADLALRLGRQQSFVSRYESGQRRLDLVELRSLCRALGVGLVEFVAAFEESNKRRRR